LLFLRGCPLKTKTLAEVFLLFLRGCQLVLRSILLIVIDLNEVDDVVVCREL